MGKSPHAHGLPKTEYARHATGVIPLGIRHAEFRLRDEGFKQRHEKYQNAGTFALKMLGLNTNPKARDIILFAQSIKETKLFAARETHPEISETMAEIVKAKELRFKKMLGAPYNFLFWRFFDTKMR